MSLEKVNATLYRLGNALTFANGEVAFTFASDIATEPFP